MKLSMNDYLYMGLPPIEIRLNGIIERYCVIADEELGFIKRFLFPYKITEDGESVVSETKYGDVEIILGDSVRNSK